MQGNALFAIGDDEMVSMTVVSLQPARIVPVDCIPVVGAIPGLIDLPGLADNQLVAVKRSVLPGRLSGLRGGWRWSFQYRVSVRDDLVLGLQSGWNSSLTGLGVLELLTNRRSGHRNEPTVDRTLSE